MVNPLYYKETYSMNRIEKLHNKIELIRSESDFNIFFQEVKDIYGYSELGLVIFEYSDLFKFEVSHLGRLPEDLLVSFGLTNSLIYYCFNEAAPIQYSQLAGELYIDNLNSVLIVPANVYRNQVACLIIYLPKSLVSSNRIKMIGDYWKIFSSKIFEIHRGYEKSNHFNITVREKECIQWASMGKTSWEISQILNVSQRTVDFHLTNCIKKTNSTNRQHAIVKCILNGAFHF
jgi:DNA-binding CsgD family transcriptional regulator